MFTQPRAPFIDKTPGPQSHRVFKDGLFVAVDGDAEFEPAAVQEGLLGAVKPDRQGCRAYLSRGACW
jgi:hypothetical protein